MNLNYDVNRYSGVHSVESIEEFHKDFWKLPADKQIRINVGQLDDGSKLWWYLNSRELDELLVNKLSDLTKKPVWFFCFRRKRLIREVYARLVLLRWKTITAKKSLKKIYKNLSPCDRNYFLTWKKR